MNRGLEITLEEKTERTVTHRFDGGIEEYVWILNKNKDTLHKEPIYGSSQKTA